MNVVFLLKLRLTELFMCIYLSTLIPFQHLSASLSPDSRSTHSFLGKWIQYCMISLNILDTSDNWENENGMENVISQAGHRQQRTKYL